MYRLLFVIFLLGMIACSPQRKLQRSYVGKSLHTLEAEFGKAKAVLDKEEGKVYVFEKTEELKSTEISQAKLTLDPMITPKVTKTERYYATVKDGVVTAIELEKEYERK